MLILGLDSTAVTASAAVADFRDGTPATYSLFTVKNKLTHSENLMPMVEHVLQIYGASVSELDLLAVNAGPGSFTGVRIGVSTVKGLAYPRSLPCAAVSTLEALAENLSGTEGTVCALMDARRGQFYCALFSSGIRLTSDDCLSADELKALLKDRQQPLTLCGDGALPFLSLCDEQEKHRFRAANPVCREQNALSTAICGYRLYAAGKAVNGKDLRPIYLRLPQAERERLENAARQQNHSTGKEPNGNETCNRM